MNWEKADIFIAALEPLSRAGWDPWGPYVQAIHETGFFKRIIGNHNYWGMKKPKHWEGLIVDVATHEFIDATEELCKEFSCGKIEPHKHKVDGQAEFVDFADANKAIEHYSGKIAKLYPLAFRQRHIPKWFFDGLVSGDPYKWATDPHYAYALQKLHEEVIKDEQHILKMRPRLTEFLETINTQEDKT